MWHLLSVFAGNNKHFPYGVGNDSVMDPFGIR